MMHDKRTDVRAALRALKLLAITGALGLASTSCAWEGPPEGILPWGDARVGGESDARSDTSDDEALPDGAALDVSDDGTALDVSDAGGGTGLDVSIDPAGDAKDDVSVDTTHDASGGPDRADTNDERGPFTDGTGVDDAADDRGACAGTWCGPRCVDTQTDVDNCGACGTPCSVGPGGAPTCEHGSCGLVCSSGFGNCDGDLSNGCEANFLSDANHCGACGHSCLGGPCLQGRCQPVTLTVGKWPAYVSVDDRYIYYSAQGTRENKFTDGSIRRVGIDRNSADVVLVAPVEFPRAVANDGINVYWADDVGFGAARKSPYDGGGAPLWSERTSGGTTIALTATRAYTASMESGYSASNALEGGDRRSGDGPSAAIGIAVDAAYFYALSYQAEVFRYTLVNEVPADQSGIYLFRPSAAMTGQAMARYGDNLYWTGGPSDFPDASHDGFVMRTTIDGSASTVLADHQDGPLGITVDETAVYWANYFEGTIMKYDLVAGRTIVMARGQDHPMGVAVDNKAVYWANNSEFGSVMKLAKETDLSPPMGDGGAPPSDAASVDASTDAQSEKSLIDATGEGTDCVGPRYQQCREDGPCYDTYTDQWHCGCRWCNWNQHCLVGICVY